MKFHPKLVSLEWNSEMQKGPYILKPRWPPVIVGARSRQSYGRIGYCEQSKRSIGRRSSSVVICTGIRFQEFLQSNPALRTPRYYGQFALSLGKESPYIFSKFNPLNTDIMVIWTPR